MKHEDYLGQYMAIQKREVQDINDVLVKHFNGECHFEDYPYVTAVMPNQDEPLTAKVMSVKAPISTDFGIFVIPNDYVDDDPIEIGYGDISFGDIDSIFDNMPEPWKSYTFSWDGGDIPKRHEKFAFKCDADAMMAAREFKNRHHIDIISVLEYENCGDGTFAKRRVVVYK